MKKALFLVLSLAFFFCAPTSSFGQNKPTPDVKISPIPFPLKWELSPLQYKVTGNGIAIEAGKETDFYTFVDGNYYTNNVPKLLFTPDSNFIFTAKVKTDFITQYDGGAILVYSDAENWAKILFENNDGKIIGVGSSVVKDKKTDDSYHAIIQGKEVYLKVAKSDKVFCFYYSLDGKAWTLVRTFGYEKLATMRIGFYAQSPKGPSCRVDFSHITYRGIKFKDFMTGE